MKISEYIKVLENIKTEHGDLEVDYYYFGRRKEANAPEIAFRKILKGRERTPDYWDKYSGNEDRKGEKVVRI
jgi:hypothetical protein